MAKIVLGPAESHVSNIEAKFYDYRNAVIWNVAVAEGLTPSHEQHEGDTFVVIPGSFEQVSTVLQGVHESYGITNLYCIAENLDEEDDFEQLVGESEVCITGGHQED